MNDTNELDVYLHGVMAGTLQRRSQAKLRFTYREQWVAENGQPLSLSLPVRPEPYDHDECAPFFEGLLPEGDFLKAIARTLHVSAANPFQLLTELGGECAGAISVAPAGGPEPGQDPRPPRWLSEKELGELLGELPRRPLLAAIDETEDGGGFRLSLAGAQNKVGVLPRGDEIGLSHGRPATTEILKAPIPHVSESVANEAFCMSLASHIDLDVAVATPRIADSQEYLLVHRYDRGGDARDGRIHQEDFCQALGLVPAVKYESEGGPGISDCAELIRRHCSAPARDMMTFLDSLLFNFAIANYDGHSKNYSLLLDGPGSIRLAPLYDLLSTIVFQGTDRKLAMRFGRENRPAYIRRRHLDRLAEALSVKPVLVRRRATAMRERLQSAAEGARLALPPDFQDRAILDRVMEVLGEQGEALAKRATEPSDGESEAANLPEAGEINFESADQVTAGIAKMNAELDAVTEAITGAAREVEQRALDPDAPVPIELEARLAAELKAPARAIKEQGRATYEALVDFDSEIEAILEEMRGKAELTKPEISLLETIVRLADSSDDAIQQFTTLHRVVSELVPGSEVLRPSIRDIRAGLSDMLKGEAHISALGQQATDVLKR